MKKLYFILLAVLCLTLTACDKEPKENCFQEVPFTEFIAWQKGCSWDIIDIYWTYSDLIYHFPDGRIDIMNCNEELRSRLWCFYDYPSIDFSKYTLLVVPFIFRSGIEDINISFRYYSKSSIYKLDIEVILNLQKIGGVRNVALLVDKWDENSKIEVNIRRR